MKKFLIAGGCALALFLTAALLPIQITQSWDFHNSLWGPARLLMAGQTPYTFDAPYGPFPSVWWPQGLGAFAWLGLLPFRVAANLWFLSTLAGLVVMIWLAAGRRLPSPGLFLACLLLVFLFPPLYIHLHLSQFSIPFALIILVVATTPGTRWWAPLLLAVGLMKPQLGLLVYPGMLAYVFHESGWRGSLRWILGIAGWSVMLMLPLFLGYPGWLKDFVFITFDNLGKGWELPTLFVVLTNSLGPAGLALWAPLLLAGLAASIRLWRVSDRLAAAVWSLALTPLVTAYASSWDFTLLLPALLWSLIRVRRRLSSAFLLVGAGGIAVLQVVARIGRDIPDGTQWWVPSALLLVLLGAFWIERRGTLGERIDGTQIA